MTYDASNRKQVRQAEKSASLSQANRIAYTRRIMSDQPGREWMHGLLSKCNIFHTPYVNGSADATAFNCGAHNLGLQIFNDVVAHAPTEYVLMMQEANVKELVNERRNSDERTASGERPSGEDGGWDADRSIETEYDPYATADA